MKSKWITDLRKSGVIERLKREINSIAWDVKNTAENLRGSEDTKKTAKDIGYISARLEEIQALCNEIDLEAAPQVPQEKE